MKEGPGRSGMAGGEASAHTMRANQVRLDLSSMAYVLLSAIRRLALAGTELATLSATRSGCAF